MTLTVDRGSFTKHDRWEPPRPLTPQTATPNGPLLSCAGVDEWTINVPAVATAEAVNWRRFRRVMGTLDNEKKAGRGFGRLKQVSRAYYAPKRDRAHGHPANSPAPKNAGPSAPSGRAARSGRVVTARGKRM